MLLKKGDIITLVESRLVEDSVLKKGSFGIVKESCGSYPFWTSYNVDFGWCVVYLYGDDVVLFSEETI